jgi:hypothetical protein
MVAGERDYLLKRAQQENEAAALSQGSARQRHEELASAYSLRARYLGREDLPPANPMPLILGRS